MRGGLLCFTEPYGEKFFLQHSNGLGRLKPGFALRGISEAIVKNVDFKVVDDLKDRHTTVHTVKEQFRRTPKRSSCAAEFFARPLGLRVVLLLSAWRPSGRLPAKQWVHGHVSMYVLAWGLPKSELLVVMKGRT